jgi:hypothetical protein
MPYAVGDQIWWLGGGAGGGMSDSLFDGGAGGIWAVGPAGIPGSIVSPGFTMPRGLLPSEPAQLALALSWMQNVGMLPLIVGEQRPPSPGGLLPLPWFQSPPGIAPGWGFQLGLLGSWLQGEAAVRVAQMEAASRAAAQQAAVQAAQIEAAARQAAAEAQARAAMMAALFQAQAQELAARAGAAGGIGQAALQALAERAIAQGNIELARRLQAAQLPLQAYSAETERLAALAPIVAGPLVQWYLARGMPVPQELQQLVQLLMRPAPTLPPEVVQAIYRQLPESIVLEQVPWREVLAEWERIMSTAPQIGAAGLGVGLGGGGLGGQGFGGVAGGGGGGQWIGGGGAAWGGGSYGVAPGLGGVGSAPPQPQQPTFRPAVTPEEAALVQAKLISGEPLTPADKNVILRAYMGAGVIPPQQGYGGPVAFALLDQYRWGYGTGAQPTAALQNVEAARVRDKVVGFLIGRVPLESFTPDDGLWIMEANRRLGRPLDAPVDYAVVAELNQMAWGVPD